jgi:hypothetical protein
MKSLKPSIKFKRTTLFLIPLVLAFFALSSATQAVPSPPSPTNVNVVNTPNVSVVNTTASPVPVRDVDNPARQPFEAQVVGGFADGAATTGDITIATVPAGKLLVIEHVSVFGTMLPGQKLVRATIQTEDVSIYLRISPQGSNAGGSRDYFIASGAVWTVTGKVHPVFRGTGERDSFAGANPDSVTFTISGYFVNCPTCVP